MFDTLKCIFSGLTGGLRDTREARKLVWLLTITFVAGLLATAFAAWVSYPAYRGMVQYLPGSEIIAISFTAGVALFIYFVLAYLSGFSVEIWRGVPMQDRNYHRLGAIIFGICAAVFLSTDFYMNMQGKGYRAQQAAGTVAAFTYVTPADQVQRLAADRRKVDQLTSGKIGGLGWRDPKTGIFHLNQSGKRTLKALELSIRRTEQADSTARTAFLSDQVRTNADRDRRENKIGATLENAVYGVYLFVLLLTIVQAYVVEVIQAATYERGTLAANADQKLDRERQGSNESESSKDSESGVQAIREEIETLKDLITASMKEKPDSQNAGKIGYQVTPEKPGTNPWDSNPVFKEPKTGFSGNEKTGFHTYQKEIETSNQNPVFTERHQPDSYRGIDQKKYNKYLKAAREYLDKNNRYNKAAIARNAGISESAGKNYFKVAIEKGDLE